MKSAGNSNIIDSEHFRLEYLFAIGFNLMSSELYVGNYCLPFHKTVEYFDSYIKFAQPYSCKLPHSYYCRAILFLQETKV